MCAFNTVAILANPLAGQGNGRVTARHLEEGLETAGIGATTLFDAPAVADPRVLAAAEAIISIGGDGTLRAVASRCLQVRGDIPPLLLVPMGTANLMGRHLGIHWAVSDLAREVVQTLQTGRIVTLDAGQANGQLFLMMAGIGLDAMIVHELARMRDGPIKYASYVLPAALAILNYRYTPLEVAVDGKEIFPSAPAMAFVANISEYGTGFPIVPDARPDDGLLDVCVVSVDSPVGAVQKFLQSAAGGLVRSEGVVYARGKQIEVRSPQLVPVQIDGDPAGHTPLRIDLLPMRVPFIVPG
jgi:diacylglycerol kinase (ATP)